MTSITELLSPWPITKHSVVLREQPQPYSHTHLTPPQDSVDTMQQPGAPSSPNDPQSEAQAGSVDSDGDNNDGRKGFGKRELSTSKRAAQNRAAQVSRSVEEV